MPCAPVSPNCSRRAALAGAFALAATVRAGSARQATPTVPDAASELVLRMEYHGGLTPEGFALLEMPIFSLYADGAIYGLGAQIAIFPPPALPPVTRMRIDATGVADLVARAREIGLGASHELIDRRVADAPLTVFTFVDGGERFVTACNIVGLGIEPDPMWSKADVQLLRALEELASLLGGPGVTMPVERIIESETLPDPERLQIVAAPAEKGAGPLGIPDLAQPALPWPLETPLAVFGSAGAPGLSVAGARCGEAAGNDAATLVAALRQANQQTPWTSEGVAWGVYPRPLLPDESACAAGISWQAPSSRTS